MKRIFVQFAMRLEAQPTLDRLNAVRMFPDWVGKLPFEIYQASSDGLDMRIGIAGDDPRHDCDSIGSVPAAVLAQLAIAHLDPQLIVNAGTCGGFQSKGHQIAEVLVGTKYVAFHHRRSSIPAMHDYGIGKYPVSDSAKLRKNLGLREGVVTSGDALDYSKEDQEYIAANGGTLKEMEAAAIGWVCSFTQTPLLPIKTITDWVDHPADTGVQFLANYSRAVESLSRELVQVFSYLGKNPQDPIWN